jgi:hypothetical protein
VTEILEKLVAAGIQMIPAEITSHFILERDGFVAFVERRQEVERREEGFGNIGAPGLMTERGFRRLSGAAIKHSSSAKALSSRPRPNKCKKSDRSPRIWRTPF